MARRVEVRDGRTLEAYESVAHLAPAVGRLRGVAARVVPRLEGRTVWMVNSTEKGGGVAEMLPGVVTLLRDLGVATEWVVLESDDPAFFPLTKNLHNLIHGAGRPDLGPGDRHRYEAVVRQNARRMRPWLARGDVLAVHDPQPMGLASALEDVGLHALWRCHIGLDAATPETRAAWTFLAPYAAAYRRALFSAPEYVPDLFAGRASVLFPALDPLAHKNRDLSLHKLVGVLANAALAAAPTPVLPPMYPHVAERLQPHGAYAPANMSEDIGLLTRPIVTQISRWDALKGWRPLLDAFVCLKERAREERAARDEGPVHRRRLDLVRLVLAGPEPAAVEDDPESREVLEGLEARYLELPPHIQRDVALLALPMADRAQNALMVNALQSSSSVVVQNSIREGFGLTVTEGMWKGVPVLTSAKACGPRHQVRDGIDGRLVHDPADVEEVCGTLDAMLRASEDRDRWGRNAQRHVHDRFLIFSQ
ncbi:MAG: glycosyltransferase, partial [Gemmatimonadetes bacterium]|nr:glycosyltransferase [Gemmatimonadota bacterium]